MKISFHKSKRAWLKVDYPQVIEDVKDITAYVVNLEPCPGIVFYTENNTPAGCMVGAETGEAIQRTIEIGLDVRIEPIQGSVYYRRYQ